jgi:hypothetical protein
MGAKRQLADFCALIHLEAFLFHAPACHPPSLS